MFPHLMNTRRLDRMDFGMRNDEYDLLGAAAVDYLENGVHDLEPADVVDLDI